MSQDAFSAESLRALLDSTAVTPSTRKALEERLAKPVVSEPAFFNAAQFATLHAVCARLIPQPDVDVVDLPGLLDEKMKKGAGKGWRYDTMPAEAKAILRGMDGIEQTAEATTGEAFSSLSGTHKDEVLRAVQDGTPPGAIWKVLPAARFFEELLTALVELYYSHPIAKAQIGDRSFADAHGWVRIGLQQQTSPKQSAADILPS